MTEKWKEIPGYGRYEVSDLGNVRRDGKEVVQIKDWNGYMYFNAKSDEGPWRKLRTSRAVITAFVTCTADTKTTQVDHINHVKTDNRLINLRWVNPHENKAAAVEHDPLRYQKRSNERPVMSVWPDGTQRYYHCIAAAAKDVIARKGLECREWSAAAYIWYAINGRFPKAYGIEYRYATEQDIINNYKASKEN